MLPAGKRLLGPWYPTETHGAALPEGAVLLIANHQSYADWAPIQLSQQRPIRFVALATFFRLWWSGWFLRAFGTIPIESGHALGSLKSVIEALRAGEVVCLFAEGEISRTGRLHRLQEGFRLAARRAGAPVVPVWIESLWGSRLSYFGGRLLLGSRPHRLRPVRIHYGAPIAAAEADAPRLRLALLELSAKAFFTHQVAERAQAAREALACLSRNPWRRVLTEEIPWGARTWNAALLLSLSSALARCWRRRPSGVIACWVPNGLPRTLAELAAAELDRQLLCIEPGTPLEVARKLLRAAHADVFITTAASLRQLDHEGIPERRWLLDEDLAECGLVHHAASLLKNLSFPSIGLAGRSTAIRPLGDEPYLSPWWQPAVRIRMLEAAGVARGRWLVMPGAAPGWLSTWLPLLTPASVHHAVPRDKPGWLAKGAKKHRCDTLVASGPQLRAWLEQGEPLAECGLRRIFCLDVQAAPEDLTRAEQTWKIPVLRGWCDPVTGWLLALETEDPPRHHDWQPAQVGRRAGSFGRPMPGVALRVIGVDDALPCAPGQSGALELYAPTLGVSAWTDTGLTGSIDADGFVFPAVRDEALPTEDEFQSTD